jgi:predicted MFS family arabinose efflux permease
VSYNVAGIAGPTVAAVVAGLWNPMLAVLLLAGCAALGALVLLWLPTPLRPRTSAQHESIPLSAGIRAVARNRTLAIVTVASSMGQFGPGALAVVATVLAARQHHPAATGWLLSAVAVGGLVGSLGWTWRPAAPRRTPMTVMIALVGIGLPLVLAAGTASMPFTAALFAASGVFLGPFTGALFTARQNNAPAAAQAQVFTIGAGLKTTTTAAGAALGGTLAGLPSAAQLLVVGASPVVAGSLGALALALGVHHPR